MVVAQTLLDLKVNRVVLRDLMPSITNPVIAKQRQPTTRLYLWTLMEKIKVWGRHKRSHFRVILRNRDTANSIQPPISVSLVWCNGYKSFSYFWAGNFWAKTKGFQTFSIDGELCYFATDFSEFQNQFPILWQPIQQQFFFVVDGPDKKYMCYTASTWHINFWSSGKITIVQQLCGKNTSQ